MICIKMIVQMIIILEHNAVVYTVKSNGPKNEP